MTGFIADTSVFVAAEQRRAFGPPPAGLAHISVATITELRLGALRARSDDLRSLRETTLARAASFIPLVYDERVAEQLAELLSAARSAGRRVGAIDAIIAATALAHDLAIWTQDEDFDVLAAVAPELRVHRG